MSQLILDPVLSGYNLAKVNDNFKRIEEAFNTLLLHKDGSKALTSDLDVNSQKLLNVGGIEIGGVDLLESITSLQESYNAYISEMEAYKSAVEGILDEAISYGAVDKKSIGNAQAVFTTSQAYAKNSNLTLPLKYIVGKNTLRLSLGHTYLLYKGVDYEEVGVVGEESQTIKILRASGIGVGVTIEQVVDGDNDLIGIFENAQSLYTLLTTNYSPTKVEGFINSVSDVKELGIEDKISELWGIYNNLSALQVNFANTVADINTKYSTITDMYEDVNTKYSVLETLYPQLVALIADTNFDLDGLNAAVANILSSIQELQALTNTIESNAQTASTAATTATTKASEATQASVDARSYSSAASNSANASATSATNAANSATASANSASAAASSASSAQTYADNAAASASAAQAAQAAAQNIVDMYSEASEEAGRIVASADQIVTDYQNSAADIAAMVEGSDEEIASRNLDIQHSAKTWSQLIENSAEEFAGFKVSDYYKKTEIDAALANKEDTISYDSTVTENSNNVPTSGAVYAAIETAVANVEIAVDDTVTDSSSNPVKSSGIFSYVVGAINDAKTWVSGQITSAMSALNNYLSLSGGEMLGKITTSVNESLHTTRDSSGDTYVAVAERSDTGAKISFGIGTGGDSRGIWDNKTSKWAVATSDSGYLFTQLSTPDVSDDSGNIANTAYVKDCVPKSVGSGTKPVYTNGNGVVTASGSNVGSVTRPICMVSGTLTQCTHTLEKSVPSDAVFTDHTYSNFVKSGDSAAAGLVPKPPTTAGTTKYLREDCTWQVPPDTKNFVNKDNGSMAVGSFILAAIKGNGTDVNNGGTCAGSNLRIIGKSTQSGEVWHGSSTSPSGTWKNVGGLKAQAPKGSANTFAGSIWQRTA